MNDLIKQFGDKFAIIGVPCNQFGRQETVEKEEIYASLKHVRPGNGYVPNFPLTEKVDVNGKNACELFKFLRVALPTRSDMSPQDEIDNPVGILNNDDFLIPIWRPLSSVDVIWNFEKFLIDGEGNPFRRYSPNFETKALADDIEKLVKQL